MNDEKISVIIPVFNRRIVTLRCLEQLTDCKRRNMQIIIVDDGSTDGSSEAIKKDYPMVHIIKGTGSWWYTKSVNEGLKYSLQHTTSDYYLLLNNDIDLANSYLDVVEDTLKRYKNQRVIFGSVSFNSENTLQPVFLGIKKFVPWLNKQYCYSYNEYLKALADGKDLLDSIFLPGRGMYFSKKTLVQNGFLDESFPQYASDFEYSARGRNSGIKTWISLHAVLYSHEKSTGAGSPKNKPTFGQFLSSLFNKYSPTYPVNNYRLISMHIGMPILMPLTFLIVISGKFKAYFKYKYNVAKVT